eukprot:scaffold1508_cov178-Amphora_coffeaeformis.AAC.22
MAGRPYGTPSPAQHDNNLVIPKVYTGTKSLPVRMASLMSPILSRNKMHSSLALVSNTSATPPVLMPMVYGQCSKACRAYSRPALMHPMACNTCRISGTRSAADAERPKK